MEQQYIVAGYCVNAKLPEMTKEDLNKLTHLNVAFGHVKNDAITIEQLTNADVLRKIKQEHPSLTIILSIGGWSAGGFDCGRRRSVLYRWNGNG